MPDGNLIAVPGYPPGRTVWVIEHIGVTVHQCRVRTASVWLEVDKTTVSYEVDSEPGQEFPRYGRIEDGNVFGSKEAAEEAVATRRREIREWLVQTGQIKLPPEARLVGTSVDV
ncbi:MAG: hypothetical protein EOP83_01160 [Verrucomicrobiaceae bacterium]|nr:MAG: hypothetical protein EOP83_01160 [Verrucomicrobiaceae bacterium]